MDPFVNEMIFREEMERRAAAAQRAQVRDAAPAAATVTAAIGDPVFGQIAGRPRNHGYTVSGDEMTGPFVRYRVDVAHEVVVSGKNPFLIGLPFVVNTRAGTSVTRGPCLKTVADVVAFLARRGVGITAERRLALADLLPYAVSLVAVQVPCTRLEWRQVGDRNDAQDNTQSEEATGG